MTHINQRRDTAANWAFTNPVLQLGEVGWESDSRRSKLGDGVSAWNDLLYTVSDLTVTKADVGLDQVDNTSDLDKPVSTATEAALDVVGAAIDLKAPLASPAFTGNPTAPTPASGDNDTSLATTAFVKAAVDAAVAAAVTSAITQALDAAHPVGSYYTSEVATDPATLFGGTWARVKGKFVVGVDEADTDLDTPGDTGGAKRVALSITEMPSHNHGGATVAAGAHQHYTNSNPGPAPSSGGTTTAFTRGNGNNVITNLGLVQSDGSHAHGITSQGGGASHENMPPFVAAYVWKRIA